MKREDNFTENEAVIADNRVIENEECEKCETEYMFAMRDNYHEFFISLQTVLSCLAFAEREGIVPDLPLEWWQAIHSRYPQ